MRLGRADRWVLVGLLGLGLWLLRGPLFTGQVLYARDIHLVWHAQVEAFVRAVAAGSWPVWDPTLSFGQPLLANPNVQALYPLTWLNLLLRPWTVYTVLIVTHLLWTSAGLYALGRQLGLSRAGAGTAAAVWTASGPLLSLGSVWHHFMGASWIPWVFLLALIALRSGRIWHAVLWGGSLAAQVLAGSPDMSALTSLALAGFLLTQLEWRRPAGPASRRVVTMSAVAAAFALAFSAAQWLTSLEAARRSARWSFPAGIQTYWSVHPLGLLDTVVPGLWSVLPLGPVLSAVLFESREPFLPSLYLGLPAAALVAAALAGPRRPLRGFLVGLGLCAGLLALGQHGPVHGVALLLWPPLRLLRYPVKAMALVAFAWSVLAGMGLDVWRSQPGPSSRRWRLGVTLPAGGLLLLCLAAGLAVWTRPPALMGLLASPAGDQALSRADLRLLLAGAIASAGLLLVLARGRWGSRPHLAGAVALLAVADLAAFHRNLQPLAPRALFTHRPAALEAMQGQSPRVYVYDYTALQRSERYLGRPVPFALARVPEGWTLEQAQALGMQMALVPLTAGRWGVPGSYELDYLGLYPTPLSLLTVLIRRVEETPLHTRLLRLGGVSHVVARHGRGLEEELITVATLPGLFADPIRVFRVPDSLPRTYVVGGARVADNGEALALLVDPGFDPRREVILAAGTAIPEPPSFSGASRVVDARPDRLRLEAELNQPGHLVLLESYDPGWRVRVDGEEQPLLRANMAFRAVALNPGRHVLEFVYRPRALSWGLGLGLAGVLAALAVAVRSRRGPGAAGGPS